MTRLISDPTVWAEHLRAGRRDEVCNWLLANGLDPLAVLSTHPTTIEDTPAGPVIRCTIVELDADQPQQRTVPLVLAPPEHWPVHQLAPGDPANGPTIAECARDDRRWAFERAGE